MYVFYVIYFHISDLNFNSMLSKKKKYEEKPPSSFSLTHRFSDFIYVERPTVHVEKTAVDLNGRPQCATERRRDDISTRPGDLLRCASLVIN